MSCVGTLPGNMNTKAFSDLRTSDQRNFSYKIDAGIQKKLENKQRVDGVGTEQAVRQCEMEKQLSNSEIRKQQKMIQRKMQFLKQRLEECRERHDTKMKKSQEWENKERERLEKEYEEASKHRSGRGRRGTFVTVKFPAKNKPATEEPAVDHQFEETPKPKRQKNDYHFEVIKKAPLSEPSAIWSVRRQRRTTDQETGRFLYRALSELEKVGEKHHEQYVENVNKLRKLEKQTGMCLDRKGPPETIKREPWWMLRPESPSGRPTTPASSFISQLEVKEKELHRTIEKLRQTYPYTESPSFLRHGVKLQPIPLRAKTFSMPEIPVEQMTPSLGSRRKTEGMVVERKVTFVDVDDRNQTSRSRTVVATKEDVLSRKSTRQMMEIQKGKSEDCRARVALFLNKANPNSKLPPPKDKFAKPEPKPMLELPKINILVMTGEKYRDTVDNPFMEGLVLPKVSRSRDLLDNSSKELDAMWSWLGFETPEEFMAAVKGLKKSKKQRAKEEEEAAGPHSEVLAQLELAGVDASQLKKLAQLESMLPDGFNDLDLESDDETEAEVEEEDPRFTLFDKSVISSKKKTKSAKRPTTQQKSSKPKSRDNTMVDDPNKTVPIKHFKMVPPGRDSQTGS